MLSQVHIRPTGNPETSIRNANEQDYIMGRVCDSPNFRSTVGLIMVPRVQCKISIRRALIAHTTLENVHCTLKITEKT